MVSQLADIYSKMDNDTFRILRAIESLLPKYEYPPLDIVERRARLPPGRFKRALEKLVEMKLLRKSKHQLMGYTLTFQALDLLALRTLVARGTISEIGGKIGVGKESEVYKALSPTGMKLIVKFHREGTRSFKSLRKTRLYMADSTRKHWLIKAKLIGEREYKALDTLYNLGALVPKPIDWNRHAVVQEYIEGVELYIIPDNGLPNPSDVLDKIIATIEIAYKKAGIVHGDLSEYNILVSTSGDPYIIDWPQYVYRDDPIAEDLLERDVYYIIRFFNKKFRLGLDPRSILERVKGSGDGG
ncbi:MAG: serine/threonine protein kinase [Desulfurococcales archaeon]|nr:serine/threonine protein kinase [Desulfurococcales archaeon]MEB3758945.1 serine/threonine protein kinase [Desulfurococcales archaeon]